MIAQHGEPLLEGETLTQAHKRLAAKWRAKAFLPWRVTIVRCSSRSVNIYYHSTQDDLWAWLRPRVLKRQAAFAEAILHPEPPNEKLREVAQQPGFNERGQGVMF